MQIPTCAFLIKPYKDATMKEQALKTKCSDDKRRSKSRIFVAGEGVLVHTVTQKALEWLKILITKAKSPVTFLVSENCQALYVYTDRLRKFFLDPTSNTTAESPGIRLPHTGDVVRTYPLPGVVYTP